MRRHGQKAGDRALRLLSIDPGRDKCGLAVVDERDGVLARGVVPTSVVGLVARDWAAAHRPNVMVLGKGTGYRQVRKALTTLNVAVDVIPEANTTLRARQLYFRENPPRGWLRLLPSGLRTPPVPIDDYAAVLIAEDYLRERAK